MKGRGDKVVEEVARGYVVISGGWGAVGAQVGGRLALGLQRRRLGPAPREGQRAVW